MLGQARQYELSAQIEALRLQVDHLGQEIGKALVATDLKTSMALRTGCSISARSCRTARPVWRTESVPDWSR